MKSLWRHLFPREVLNIETSGEQARIRAERDLAQAVVEKTQTEAQTPYYADLGRDLRDVRSRNHIADRIRASIREA